MKKKFDKKETEVLALPEFEKVKPPSGEKITISHGQIEVPKKPIIPVIPGDGIGRDVVKATQQVVDAAVFLQYSKKREIAWFEVYAGDAALEKYGNVLPKDTIEAIQNYLVAIKGPLTTPVGGGFRSLNVTLRQMFDLFANVRPIFYIPGVPSPVKYPELVDMVIFRENTEDVYQGIEWSSDSDEAMKMSSFLKNEFDIELRRNTGIGLKPISKFGSQRLVRKAIEYAIANKRRNVTLVHKGNIMKYTEGAFKDWGYEIAESEFADATLTEDVLYSEFKGKPPTGKIVIKDRIADNMLQQVLTRTKDYDIIATTNLNGDYLSDAIAAQVGGLGVASGANFGESIGLFEAVHGTAPKYADKDIANPMALMLSAKFMLEHLGWNKAAERLMEAIKHTIQQKKVTQDLARQLDGVSPLKTSEFANEIISTMESK
ncbi:MAG: isocitrate dehydrogenase (NADP(+)) [Candidatus Ranarchaeia archaeon]